MKLVKFIVTGFGVGTISSAPGTLGSLLAFPLCYLLLLIATQFRLKINISSIPEIQQEILAIILLFIVVFMVILVSGKYLSDIYIKHTGVDDPKEVVIDEIMGQMLTIMLSFMSAIFIHKESYITQYCPPFMIDIIFMGILPFIFFRFFDILKPWPINIIDSKIKGGLGVMLDDFVAGIFAAIMCYAVAFIFI